MSVNYVIIHYGPCNTFHTIAHKPQKLRGLKDRLQKLGYRVDLKPVEYINYCMIKMCGHEVFRCNIQNLSFNVPSELDPVCQSAVKAVLTSTELLSRACNYLYFKSLIDDQIFKRGEFAPKDYYLREPVDIEPFTSCLDCVGCCDILVQKKPE
ncbi:hypothetical protein evm_008754 [Chilo suppressalis]|nr:hypothetical protein evm_008754 [Chilo suppressalis]